MEGLWIFAGTLSLENNKYINGQGDIAAAVYAVENMYNAGARTIILTPPFDYMSGTDCNNMRIRRTEYLRELISDRYPGLKLCMGSMVQYYSGFLGALGTGLAKTIEGSRYVLVDFDRNVDFSFVRNAVKECFAADYRMIINNIFKYSFAAEYGCIEELVENGGYISGDFMTLDSKLPRAFRKTINQVIENGLLHIMTVTQNTVWDEGGNYVKAVGQITRRFGIKTAEKIFYDNYMKLISNEYIE